MKCTASIMISLCLDAYSRQKTVAIPINAINDD